MSVIVRSIAEKVLLDILCLVGSLLFRSVRGIFLLEIFFNLLTSVVYVCTSSCYVAAVEVSQEDNRFRKLIYDINEMLLVERFTIRCINIAYAYGFL